MPGINLGERPLRTLLRRGGRSALSRTPEPTAPGQRVGVVVNPVRPSAREAVGVLQRMAPDARVLPTTIAEPGAAQARTLLERGCDAVVVVGGDGTVREVARVLAGTGTPVGIMPTGTANLLARNLGLVGGRSLHAQRAMSLEQQVRVALTGAVAGIDLGRVLLDTAHGAVEEVFLVVAGLGNDARTLELVPARVKHHLGWPAYFAPAPVTLLAPRPWLEVQCDGDPPEPGRRWSVLVGNATGLPGGASFAPGAHCDDGLLDVVEVTARTPVQWWRVARRSLRHGAGPDPDQDAADGPGVRQRTARRVVLRPEHPCAVQLDGDVVPGVGCLTAWVDAGALRVRVPPTNS